MSETPLMRRIMVHLSRAGAHVFRNNVGQGWVGKSFRLKDEATLLQAGTAKHLSAGTVIIMAARPLHAGLLEGSSDLIGWKPVVITQEMVGKTFGLFFGCEVKDGLGVQSPEQIIWARIVNGAGGLAFVARSEDEAVEKYLKG